MDNKILEVLVDMQKGLLDMKKDLKDINNRLDTLETKVDKVDFKMSDGFETLELLSENSSTELNKVKIKVCKLEKRVTEMNIMN